MPLAVLGHVANAWRRAWFARAPGEVASVERDGAAVDGPQAGQSFDELGLPVALDAGDREDLATAAPRATRP